jgi:cytoskeletal protein RodZ
MRRTGRRRRMTEPENYQALVLRSLMCPATLTATTVVKSTSAAERVLQVAVAVARRTRLFQQNEKKMDPDYAPSTTSSENTTSENCSQVTTEAEEELETETDEDSWVPSDTSEPEKSETSSSEDID